MTLQLEILFTNWEINTTFQIEQNRITLVWTTVLHEHLPVECTLICGMTAAGEHIIMTVTSIIITIFSEIHKTIGIYSVSTTLYQTYLETTEFLLVRSY